MTTSSTQSPPWWQRTTVYQIYPRSFLDTDGDGIGDLAGVISRLGYLAELGVETLWLSPIFKSPQADFGYDVSDYREIAPEYGSLADVQVLIKEAHRRQMKVVFDLVLNHTSIQHPWFVESRKDKVNARRDFYIWRPGKKPNGAAPPNNWRSMRGPGGWHYDKVTGEWYWASFMPFQPDLNYRNPAVVEEMFEVVRYWLGQGIDGLRLDVFHAIFKDANFADNPAAFRPLPSDDNANGFFQTFRHTLHHPDTLLFARQLRKVVDEFQDPPRFLVGEAFGPPNLLRAYCEGGDGLHAVFLFKSLRAEFSAPAFRALLTEFDKAFAAPLVPTYVFGNHDRPRVSERMDGNPEQLKLLAALQLTARGVPFIYYGEELGLPNLNLGTSHALDPVARSYRFVPDFVARRLRKRGVLLNRDEARGPMQWSGVENAGFSPPGSKPWLPVHGDFAKQNAEVARGEPDSLYNCYRRFLELRASEPALQTGTMMLHGPGDLPSHVLAFRRASPETRLDVLLNFSAQEQPVNVPGLSPTFICSTSANPGPLHGRHYVLRPYEGIITQVVADSKVSFRNVR